VNDRSPPLANKHAIVTGGSRGIGAAICRRLAADGASVVVNYSGSLDAALAVVAEIEHLKGKAIAVRGDLSDPAAIPALFDAAEAAFGKPDILINNAGVPGRRSVEQIDVEHYASIFDINVRGSLLASAEMARRMNDGGRIIYISSGAARMAGGGRSVYAGSKAAIKAFARSQSIDLGPRGITVNAVAPVSPTRASCLTKWRRRQRKSPLSAVSASPTNSQPSLRSFALLTPNGSPGR